MTARMKGDLATFANRVQYNGEGNKLNPLKLDGIESTDIKILAAKLAHINAVLIHEGLPQRERLIKLNKIAIQQMSVLQDVENRKLLR
jgi:hypothetical protein